MTRIITDSTCDLTLAEAEALGLTMLSLHVNFGSESYEDKRTITNEQFYQKLRESETLPTTSLLNVGDFQQAFSEFPDEPIVVLTISRKLSGTCQSAILAREACGREDIYIVDSGTVSIGLGLLVKQAAAMRDSGVPAGEIAERLSALAGRVRVLAVLDTLKYLVKGGRLSGMQGAVGGLLMVKPLVSLEGGKVVTLKKAPGSKAAVRELAALCSEAMPIDREMPLCFGYSCSDGAMQKLRELTGFPEAGDVYVIGSVVGTHAGPGVAAIAYFEKRD